MSKAFEEGVREGEKGWFECEEIGANTIVRERRDRERVTEEM